MGIVDHKQKQLNTFKCPKLNGLRTIHIGKPVLDTQEVKTKAPKEVVDFINAIDDLLGFENLNYRLATRNQYPPQIMDWIAVNADGRSPIVFIELDVEVNATYYQENIPKATLKQGTDKRE